MSSYPREPRAYELMAILVPELSDEDLTAAIDRVSGYIAASNGEIREILQDSPWGRRRLAYTIRFNGTDYRDGFYVIWHFDLVPSGMGDIERELKLDTRVIRYLIVHDDPKWGSPQEREAAAAAAQEVPEAEVEPAGETAAGAAVAEGAVAEAIVDEAVAEEAVAEAVVAEAVAEEAVLEAEVAEATAEEAVAEAAVAEAVAEEAVVEAEVAEVIAEEAVAETVVEEAEEVEAAVEEAEAEVAAKAAVETSAEEPAKATQE
ncbi:MAG TPA: 30S ribosomal protein S6 [Thermomicrobiales bacterium]|nr:30S ribosomal protein S6 [Thermomicrobiales bacterium]